MINSTILVGGSEVCTVVRVVDAQTMIVEDELGNVREVTNTNPDEYGDGWEFAN
jgi:hypothetical protein